MTAPINELLSLHSDRLLWRPVSQILPRPDPDLQSWLLDPGSLTLRLKEHADGRFRVVVLEEGWVRRQLPSLLQCFSPSVASERMWSRRVLLQCGDTPWVAAHSLIPVSSMEGELKRLRHLSNKPLGEFLFRNPLLQRRQLELTQADDIWGRRSLFYLYGKPLLVAEFFLPALLHDTGIHLA
ncbi:MAG: chorismate lyase [Gammaproteobacteria bacterium]|nr:chorismate lyase [Gammaproteobacteria bacterium]MDP2139448.1 chorismate lyase [Gammaproteobacteria bacterium]MDP2346284.1 chorismate lyase [Gammaproteobacteria bacterium]